MHEEDIMRIERKQRNEDAPFVPQVVDFHTHLLPQIDDGASDETESAAMLELQQKQNISAIVATPHYYADDESPQTFLKRRMAACEKLLRVYDAQKYPPIYLGAEVAFFNGMGRSQRIRELSVLGTNAILVEMPFSEWGDSEIKEIYFLRESLGLIPIIAHVERYLKYQNPSAIRSLVSNGAIIQSNSTYFTDPKIGKKAIKLFLHGEIHLLGSDCHNTTSRAPTLEEAVFKIVQSHGEAALEQMRLLQNFLLKDAISIDKM